MYRPATLNRQNVGNHLVHHKPAAVKDHVDQLPFEILSTIFQNSVRPYYHLHPSPFPELDQPRAYYQSLWTIRLVSHHWKDIVDKSPILWAHVDLADPPAVIGMALEKSGGCPLVVDGAVDWDEFSERAQAIRLSRRKIIPHIVRATSLRWTSISGDPEDQTILESPAPLLEYLSVDAGLAEEEDSIQRPFSDVAPRLTHVFLAGKYMALNAAVFSNLQTLSLSHYDTPPLPFNQLREVLSRSPTLSSLLLDRVSIGAPELDQKNIAIRVPNLLKLHLLSEEPSDRLMALIGHIDAPQCLDMTIDSHTGVFRPGDLAAAAVHICRVAGIQDPTTEMVDGWSLELRYQRRTLVINRATLSMPLNWDRGVSSFVSCMSSEQRRSIGSLVLDHPALGLTLTQPLTSIAHLKVSKVTLFLSGFDKPPTKTEDDAVLGYFLLKLSKHNWMLSAMRILQIHASSMTSQDLRRIGRMAKARSGSSVPLQAIHISLAAAGDSAEWDEIMKELRDAVVEVVCNVMEADSTLH